MMSYYGGGPWPKTESGGSVQGLAPSFQSEAPLTGSSWSGAPG